MTRAAIVLFSIMVAHTLLETARDAMFLARLGPDSLAWVYLAMAGIALAAFAVVRRACRVTDPRRMVIVFLTGAVVGTSVLALTVSFARELIFVLYVWTGLVATLVVPCFWTLLDRATRVTDAKRAFAVIGAGGVLGAMVGSGLASVLGTMVDAHHLVSVGALAYLVALGCAVRLAPYPLRSRPARKERRHEAMSQRSRRYIALLIFLGAVSTVALTLGDLAFKRVMAERLPPEQLATTIGAIYAGLNALGLVIQLLVAPRLFARWGVGGALTLLPLIILLTGFGFALTGAMVAVIALKLGDGGLRHSLHRVGKELLYLPVPSSMRDGWKPVADALDLRGGEALAAIVAFLVGVDARVLGTVAAIVGGVWLVTVALARRAYLAQFRDKLRAGDVERDARVPELDNQTIDMLNDALASPDELEARAALDMLAQDNNVPALVLYHPCAPVVRRALALLRGELRPGVQRVLGHLLDHSDATVRAAALAASNRTRSHRARLVAALHDADANVRAVALVGLADDPEHRKTAVDGIAELVEGSTRDRAALAHAIEHATPHRFRDALRELAARNETPVLRHVVHALAVDPDDEDLDELLALLSDPYVRGDVRRIVTSTGQRGLERALLAFADPSVPLAVHQQLPRTIAGFGTPDAAAALVGHLTRTDDGTTEYRIIRALGRMRATSPDLPLDLPAIDAYLARTIAAAARYATYADLLAIADGTSPTSALIFELLLDKRRSSIERSFRALGILHPEAGVKAVHDALVDGGEERGAAAREILDAIAPVSIRTPLLALVEPLTADERRDRLGMLAPGPFATYEDFIAALLTDPSESLRSVVAHHVAERRLVVLRDTLVQARAVATPALITNAFDQAIARLRA